MGATSSPAGCRMKPTPGHWPSGDSNPRARYYGSATTAGFYPVMLAHLWHWTGDKELTRPLADAALEALRWKDNCADLDGDGFYEYLTRSTQGVKNHFSAESERVPAGASKTRRRTMRNARISAKVAVGSLLMLAAIIFASIPGFARDKYETIDATAMGTSTQMGRVIAITLNIYDWSTAADKQILMDAYAKGQNQGLSSALHKMKAVGHVEITGTLGYDCSYIAQSPTPTGRKIRFITNRKITFGEAWSDSPTMAYDLTAGEIDINEQNRSKSTGVLYPAAQLTLNSQGQLAFELNQNPWKLVDIIDWKGTPGLN